MSALCLDQRPCPVATQGMALVVTTVLGAALAEVAGGPILLTLGYPALGLAGAVALLGAEHRERAPSPPFPRRPQRTVPPRTEHVMPRPRRPERARSQPRRPEGGLWRRGPAAHERALGYVRLDEHARSAQFARHAHAIERLCEARGLGLADIACDVGGAAGSASARPGLTWALRRLAADDVGCLIVPRLDHLSDLLSERGQLVGWFRERGVALLTAEHGPGTPAARAPNRPPDGAVYPRAVRGVDPRSWAAYARTTR
jgi:hypothetical protein